MKFQYNRHSLKGITMLLLFFLTSTAMLRAQTPFEYFYFQNLIERGQCSDITSDGGVVSIASIGAIAFMFTKTDNTGAVQYQKFIIDVTFTGPVMEPQEVIQTANGGYAVTGYYRRPGAMEDIFLMRLDANGNLLWTQFYNRAGQEFGYSLKELSGGGFAIAGEALNSSGPTSDIVIIRTDTMGNNVWTQVYNEGKTDEGARAIIQTSDGNLAVTGYREEFVGIQAKEIIALKVNLANGAPIFYTHFGDEGEEIGLDLVEDTNGNLALTGATASVDPASEVFLAQVSGVNGALLRFTTYGGFGRDVGQSIISLGSDGYLIGGGSDSFSQDSFLNGDFLGVWARLDGSLRRALIYGTRIPDEAFDVHQTPDGGFYLHGSTDTLPGVAVAFLVKTDAMGNADCHSRTVIPYVDTPILYYTQPAIYSFNFADPVRDQFFDPPFSPLFLKLCSGGVLAKNSPVSALPAPTPFPDVVQAWRSSLGTESILDADPDVLLEAWPNPARNVLQVRVNPSIQQVALYDLQGRLLLSRPVSATALEFDLAEVPAGTYLLRGITADGHSSTQRIVKE